MNTKNALYKFIIITFDTHHYNPLTNYKKNGRQTAL